MRLYPMGIIIVFLLAGYLPVSAQSTDTTATLDRIIQYALTNNPGLKSIHDQTNVQESKVSQAGALPDPVLSLNLLNLPVNTFSFSQEPMTGKQISIMQAFPFPGKLSLKSDIARTNVNISKDQYNEVKVQLIRNIRTTYYKLYYVDQALKTVSENTGVLKSFVEIAETRYSVGKGIQQDVLRAQVELSKMLDKHISLTDQEKQLMARIAALAGRPYGEIHPVLPEPKFIAPDETQLMKSAMQNRPLLKAWQQMITRSTQQVRLAKKNFYPDFKVGVAYTQRDILNSGASGVDFVSGLFSVNVPIFYKRKQDQSLQEMKFQKNTVQYKYQDLVNELNSSIEQNISSLNKNERLLKLYKSGIIPQAKQSLQSAISGYQTGVIDFLTLLNNQMSLFNLQLDYYKVISDYYSDIANLEAVVGKPLQN